METKEKNKPGQKLMIYGLFVIAAANILPRFFHMPDIVRGIFLGAGLAMEIMALVMMRKNKD